MNNFKTEILSFSLENKLISKCEKENISSILLECETETAILEQLVKYKFGKDFDKLDQLNRSVSTNKTLEEENDARIIEEICLKEIQNSKIFREESHTLIRELRYNYR